MIKKIRWIIEFILLFGFPFFCFIFGIDTSIKNIENASALGKPELNVSTYATYSADFEKYLENQLPFRNLLITAYGMIEYYIFRDSPSEEVILGNNGWAFLSDTIEDFQADNLYSFEELQDIAQKLEETNRYFEEHGAKLIIYIAPNKATIYGQNMPANIKKKNHITKAEQVYDYLEKNTNICIIYPKKELEKFSLKTECYTYFKNDTHWNYLGGYIGSGPLLKQLGIDSSQIPQIMEVNKSDFPWNGYDLANLMGMTNKLNEDYNYEVGNYTGEWEDFQETNGLDVTDFNTFYRIQDNGKGKDQRKVMFLRDSFGTAMLPYLMAYFEDIFSPHYSYYYTSDMLMEEKPDIVIWEFVERRMDDYFKSLPQDK